MSALAVLVGWRGIAYYQWDQAQQADKRRLAAAEQAMADQARAKAAAAESEFAAGKGAILAELQALAAARRWDDASKAAAKYRSVTDPDYARLAAQIRTGADEARAKVAAAEKAAADLAERERRRQAGVRIGMTAQQVRQSSWGSPERVNATHHARGTREQWVYPGHQYLYLENGILTSVQTSR